MSRTPLIRDMSPPSNSRTKEVSYTNHSQIVKRFALKPVLVLSIAAALTFASAASPTLRCVGCAGNGIDRARAPTSIHPSTTAADPGAGWPVCIASNRPGGFGGQDIWVAQRASKDDPWGAPEHLPAPVNSDVDDFCPSPTRGHGLFFVSARSRSDSCGGPDIYFTRLGHDGWEQPVNLGCNINSPAGEASPSYFEDESGNAIYFRATAQVALPRCWRARLDIYFCVVGPAQLARVSTLSEDSDERTPRWPQIVLFDAPGDSRRADIWTASRR
jgi:hypothetical protein